MNESSKKLHELNKINCYTVYENHGLKYGEKLHTPWNDCAKVQNYTNTHACWKLI